MSKIYMNEISNNNIYDSVREYCVVERVNEEYFRASMRPKEKKHKLAIIETIMKELYFFIFDHYLRRQVLNKGKHRIIQGGISNDNN